MQHDLFYNTPKCTGHSHLEIAILPLLEILGSEELIKYIITIYMFMYIGDLEKYIFDMLLFFFFDRYR